MNEPLCQRCNKTQEMHLLASVCNGMAQGAPFLVCPTATFLPKPEPMRAKPGVRYRSVNGNHGQAIGLACGSLQLERNFFGCKSPMSLDWEEVKEP